MSLWGRLSQTARSATALLLLAVGSLGGLMALVYTIAKMVADASDVVSLPNSPLVRPAFEFLLALPTWSGAVLGLSAVLLAACGFIEFRQRAAPVAFWLERVKRHDEDSPAKSIPIEVRQVELGGHSVKDPSHITFLFRLFNGSVFTLRFRELSEHSAAFLVDHSKQEGRTLLSTPKLASSFRKCNHGEYGEFALEITPDEAMLAQIKAVSSRQTEEHNSGAFDFREVVIEVSGEEIQRLHVLKLPTVDMATANRLGLKHTLAAIG